MYTNLLDVGWKKMSETIVFTNQKQEYHTHLIMQLWWRKKSSYLLYRTSTYNSYISEGTSTCKRNIVSFCNGLLKNKIEFITKSADKSILNNSL